MKKLITLIFLLSQLSFGQWWWGDSDNGYSAEAQLYFNQLSPQPASDTLDAIATFIDGLKADGVYDKIEEMWLFAINTKANALKGLKGYKNCTEVSTVTFTVYEGIAGNGTDSYLNTNYNTTGDAVNLSEDSNSLGIYSRTNSTATRRDIGQTTNDFQIVLKWTDNNSYNYFNSAALSFVATTSTGFHIITRTTATKCDAYKNGSNVVDNNATASSGVNNHTIFICSVNDSVNPSTFTTRQYSFAFVGGGLTSTDAENFNTRLETLLDFLGAGVQ